MVFAGGSVHLVTYNHLPFASLCPVVPALFLLQDLGEADQRFVRRRESLGQDKSDPRHGKPGCQTCIPCLILVGWLIGNN